MSAIDLITRTRQFVQIKLSGAEGGHDWFHIERVYRNALTILETEKANETVVLLGALLHDIADSKFHQGDETLGPKIAKEFLESQEVSGEIVAEVIAIIENISFKGGDRKKTYFSKELAIVQDADRLDAMGAIGIARAFNYGGFKHRKLFDPEVKPALKQTAEAYKKSTAPTINHFYEKLLLLKDLMNTATGKKMAEIRHRYMESYLEQFFLEWEGKR